MPLTTTAIVRRPFVEVAVDGILVTNRLAVKWSLGFDMRVGEATISVPFVPAWAKFGSQVAILAGASPATAAVRWAGIIVEFDSTLWPGRVDIVCRGPLYLAQQRQCDDPDGIDLSAAGAGQTDQQIVTYLLGQAGVLSSVVNLGGTGITLGTVAPDQYRWATGQSVLDFIDQLDQVCLGYRTYETLAGSVTRTQITATPGGTAAATFTEGVDIAAGSANQASILQAANKVEITGYNPPGGAGPFNYSLAQSNPLLQGTVVQSLSSSLIEKSQTADPGGGIACQQVAEWLLGEVNRAIATLQLQTPRDDLLGPGMTIAVDSPQRLGLNQLLWIQRVDGEVTAKGGFVQRLTCVAGTVGTGGTGPTSGGVGGGGSYGGGGQSGGGGGTGGTGGGGGGSNPPPVVGPTASFTMTVEQETVIVAGAETTLYVVSCQSAVTPGTGAIVSYAWSTSGGSPHPASGSDVDFTTSYAAISTQTITLTVTDANGLTASATQTVPAAGAIGYLRRRLFLAGTSTIDDFDGSTWRVHANSSTVVANGPIWADGIDVDTSANDLQSAPTQIAPFGSGTVTAVWFEGDASPLNILAGSSNGAIAYSGNGGTVWTICNASPSAGNPILRCVWSRSVRGQFFALTAGGLYRSDNYGNGWVLVVGAAGGETFRDVSVSFDRIMIAMAGGRLLCDQAGTAQTLPANSGDIVAVTADIRRDRFYAYDSSGNTFYHTADSGTTLGARAALPATGATRGLWRDSQIRQLLYFCAGGKAYKSVDGFGSSGGYFALRQAGVGSSPGGASYVSIGTDGVLKQAAIPTTVIQSDTTLKAYVLWTGTATGGHNTAPPSQWSDPAYSDSGWAAAIVSASVDSYPVPGSSQKIWTASSTGRDEISDTAQVLFRQHFTLPAGAISGANIQYTANDLIYGFWINGRWLGGDYGTARWPTGSTTPSPTGFDAGTIYTLTIPPSLLIAGGANLIAAWGANNNPGLNFTGPGGAWIAYALTVD